MRCFGHRGLIGLRRVLVRMRVGPGAVHFVAIHFLVRNGGDRHKANAGKKANLFTAIGSFHQHSAVLVLALGVSATIPFAGGISVGNFEALHW